MPPSCQKRNKKKPKQTAKRVQVALFTDVRGNANMSYDNLKGYAVFAFTAYMHQKAGGIECLQATQAARFKPDFFTIVIQGFEDKAKP